MIADRWMMESRRLVNWGMYEGYHEFRPSTDSQLPVTLLAGRRNPASERWSTRRYRCSTRPARPSTRRRIRGVRNEATLHLPARHDRHGRLRRRRRTDVPARPGQVRRARSILGAIVDTYRNFTTGQILSCGKFLYLMPGDGRGDVRRLYLAWDKPIDPRAWTCSASRRSRPRS